MKLGRTIPTFGHNFRPEEQEQIDPNPGHDPRSKDAQLVQFLAHFNKKAINIHQPFTMQHVLPALITKVIIVLIAILSKIINI